MVENTKKLLVNLYVRLSVFCLSLFLFFICVVGCFILVFVWCCVFLVVCVFVYFGVCIVSCLLYGFFLLFVVDD